MITKNFQKAQKKAKSLYPEEEWFEIEKRIFLAKTRLPRSKNQQEILEKELVQARILVERGSVVYLLPEIGDSGVKRPDAVVDGYVVEFKTITGGLRQIEKLFKRARQKADNVFLKIDSDIAVNDIKKKLASAITTKGYTYGAIIIFSYEGELYYWDIADLVE